MYPSFSFWRRTACLLLAGLLAVACHHEPPAMIPLDDFEDLVTEIHWANGFFQSKSTGNVYWDDTVQYNVYLMHKHGYTEAQVQKMAGGNLWRLLKTADRMRSYKA